LDYFKKLCIIIIYSGYNIKMNTYHIYPSEPIIIDLLLSVHKVKNSKSTISNFYFDASTFSKKISAKQFIIIKLVLSFKKQKLAFLQDRVIQKI
jgi:hypothetical protein